MDGFDQTVNVKVIMATNRADTLDPALLRPGRLDRKIEFPLPDRRQKRLIFQTITSKMNLSDEVDLEDYVARPDKISGADINAITQEVMMVMNWCQLMARRCMREKACLAGPITVFVYALATRKVSCHLLVSSWVKSV